MSKFVSIDIETTGLDPDTCDIIEIGAVIDDTLEPLDNSPTFHCYVAPENNKDYRGEPYALSMHSEIFKRIALASPTDNEVLHPKFIAVEFHKWLSDSGLKSCIGDRVVVAGKNFAGFDDQFLKRLPNFNRYVPRYHRILDPGMLFWEPTDIAPPDLKTCMERAGIKGEVAHTALDDAKMVARLIQVAAQRRRKLTYAETIKVD